MIRFDEVDEMISCYPRLRCARRSSVQRLMKRSNDRWNLAFLSLHLRTLQREAKKMKEYWIIRRRWLPPLSSNLLLLMFRSVIFMNQFSLACSFIGRSWLIETIHRTIFSFSYFVFVCFGHSLHIEQKQLLSPPFC